MSVTDIQQALKEALRMTNFHQEQAKKLEQIRKDIDGISPTAENIAIYSSLVDAGNLIDEYLARFQQINKVKGRSERAREISERGGILNQLAESELISSPPSATIPEQTKEKLSRYDVNKLYADAVKNVSSKIKQGEVSEEYCLSVIKLLSEKSKGLDSNEPIAKRISAFIGELEALKKIFSQEGQADYALETIKMVKATLEAVEQRAKAVDNIQDWSARPKPVAYQQPEKIAKHREGSEVSDQRQEATSKKRPTK